MKQLTFDFKKGRFIIFVSVLVVVFICVMAWIFYPTNVANESDNKKGGLNTQLPQAKMAVDSANDKMSFYSIALQDSQKREEQLRMDPYRQSPVIRTTVDAIKPSDPLEKRIQSIQQQLQSTKVNDQHLIDQKPVTYQQRDVASLAADPEMEAINQTLDKIMAIQHPAKNIEKINEKKLSGYVVNEDKENDASYFGKQKGSNKNAAFYGDDQSPATSVGLFAKIAHEQILQNGSTVKLTLGTAIYVNGWSIPIGTPVYGVANLSNDRLQILIPTIRYENNILPVSLSVYDMDGLEGIYVPGSITRDVAKESADQTIQSNGIAGINLSIPTQVVTAGIGAAKSLLSKKVKQLRVTVAAGYKVLLRDNKQMGN